MSSRSPGFFDVDERLAGFSAKGDDRIRPARTAAGNQVAEIEPCCRQLDTSNNPILGCRPADGATC